MALSVTAYHYYNNATGDPITISANSVAIADLPLKSRHDPNTLYWALDLQRPVFDNNAVPFVGNSLQSYIAFRITGNYDKIKNIKITIEKPSLYQKTGGEYVAVADDTVLMYKMTNQYVRAQAQQNAFNSFRNGKYDGEMQVITEPVTIYPRISAVSPALANSRQTEYVNSPSYWTEFIVLQTMIYPGAFDQVGNFGKSGGKDLGGITGPLLSVEIDEVGISSVT